MSRIGNLPILIPEKVTVSRTQENLVTVKGKFGELQESYPQDDLSVEITDSTITVKPMTKKDRALQGLFRSLINNMIIGVNERFEKVLEINGVGYRAQVKGQELTLSLGYSHPVIFEIPKDIEVKVEGNILTVMGISKHEVGLFAANIRSKRPPEPYKGKGIKYKNETILRKVGKAGKK